MSEDQFTDSTGEMVDLVTKSKMLKVEDDIGSVMLESHNSVNIQPSGTPFGTKVKVADGSGSAALTFDSKKLRPPQNNIDFDRILDDAISEYDEALNERSNND